MNIVIPDIATLTGTAPERLSKPEWIRLPKVGTLCPYSSLSRSKMNELVLPSELNSFKPPVKSISLRQRGSARGTRLISYDSLMAYLRSLLDQQHQRKELDHA